MDWIRLTAFAYFVVAGLCALSASFYSDVMLDVAMLLTLPGSFLVILQMWSIAHSDNPTMFVQFILLGAAGINALALYYVLAATLRKRKAS